MKMVSLFYCFVCFVILQAAVWFSTNLQFVNASFADKSFLVMIILSIPTSMTAYYGSKFGYSAFEESVWAIRFFGFAVSYLVFPLLTWYFLGESMLNIKTMSCVVLSFLIILIQVYF